MTPAEKRNANNERIVARLKSDMRAAARFGFLIGEAAETAGREGDGWRRLKQWLTDRKGDAS